MSPDEKELLERAVSLAEENNKILHGIRRASRLGLVWKVFYWIVVLAISYGAYVYVQPYADQMVKTYEGLKSTASSVQTTVEKVSGWDKFWTSFSK